MPKLLRFLLRNGCILGLVMGPMIASATELGLYSGTLSYVRIDGCCVSSSERTGVAVDLKLNVETYRLQLFGYTDRKWSEAALLVPISILGEHSGLDPSDDTSIEVRRISKFKLVFSPGLGYFVHSTRTQRFDLPALTSGVTVIGQLGAEYSFNDTWSLSGILRFAAGIAADDKGLSSGLLLGILYRY